MSKNIIVIGSGFSGLSAAAYLSKSGNNVIVVEKNQSTGGRARQLKDNGFTFDMGPSWYWMPDIFEKFFNDFGYTSSDFYQLVRLNPSFQIVFSDTDAIQIPDRKEELLDLFEKYQKGSKHYLENYLKQAKHLYDISVNKMLYKSYVHYSDYFDKNVLDLSLLKSLFSNVSKSIRKKFHHPKLIQLLEFPVIFLGAAAQNIPALYNLMNYAAFELGTWYPMGGMYEIVKAMEQIVKKYRTTVITNCEVRKIIIKNNKAIGIETSDGFMSADIVVSSADYAFTENKLIDKLYANYDPNYWENKTFAPSALIFYLGVNKSLPKLLHHNLFFDADFDHHLRSIYNTHEWEKSPLFYLSVPSKTDPSVAPLRKENLFILVPTSVGLKDNPEIHQQIFDNIISRIEKFIGTSFRNDIILKHTYSISNFIYDYNAYKGNAYGLANTLLQTAGFRPKIINKKVPNLFYTGQLTVPGPGVPPSLISGKIVSEFIHHQFKIKEKEYESIV